MRKRCPRTPHPRARGLWGRSRWLRPRFPRHGPSCGSFDTDPSNWGITGSQQSLERLIEVEEGETWSRALPPAGVGSTTAPSSSSSARGSPSTTGRSSTPRSSSSTGTRTPGSSTVSAGTYVNFKPGSTLQNIDRHTVRFSFPEPDGAALAKFSVLHMPIGSFIGNSAGARSTGEFSTPRARGARVHTSWSKGSPSLTSARTASSWRPTPDAGTGTRSPRSGGSSSTTPSASRTPSSWSRPAKAAWTW